MFFEFEIKGPAAEAQSLHGLGPAPVSIQDQLDQILFESVHNIPVNEAAPKVIQLMTCWGEPLIERRSTL
jgi:hypothetical protein